MLRREKPSDNFWKGYGLGYLSCVIVALSSYYLVHPEALRDLKLPEKPIVLVMPSEETGLPSLFKIELVDYPHLSHGNGKEVVPFDRTRIQSIGPMGYNALERMPTKKEIKWYKEHYKPYRPLQW